MKLLCQIWLSLACGVIVLEEPVALCIPVGVMVLYFTVYAITVVDRDEKW